MKPVHFEYVLSSSRERVIHAVLHRLHLTPGTPLYEDLFVEGQLLFAAAYADYCTRFTAQDEHQIIMYASQRIRWGLIDYLRRERRHQATVNYGLSPAAVGGVGVARTWLPIPCRTGQSKPSNSLPGFCGRLHQGNEPFWLDGWPGTCRSRKLPGKPGWLLARFTGGAGSCGRG